MNRQTTTRTAATLVTMAPLSAGSAPRPSGTVSPRY